MRRCSASDTCHSCGTAVRASSCEGGGHMMRLWAESYSKSAPVFTSASLSVVAHVVLIGAWIAATLPSADMPSDSLANRTYTQFVPPPDRMPGTRGQRESVRYVDLQKPGPGMG